MRGLLRGTAGSAARSGRSVRLVRLRRGFPARRGRDPTQPHRRGDRRAPLSSDRHGGAKHGHGPRVADAIYGCVVAWSRAGCIGARSCRPACVGGRCACAAGRLCARDRHHQHRLPGAVGLDRRDRSSGPRLTGQRLPDSGRAGPVHPVGRRSCRARPGERRPDAPAASTASHPAVQLRWSAPPVGLQSALHLRVVPVCLCRGGFARQPTGELLRRLRPLRRSHHRRL